MLTKSKNSKQAKLKNLKINIRKNVGYFHFSILLPRVLADKYYPNANNNTMLTVHCVYRIVIKKL